MELLRKTLNITPAELPQVMLLFGMLLIYVLGWFWGVSIVEAAFLNTLGVVALPLFFVVRGMISIPILFTYTLFADRISNQRILTTILWISALVVAGSIGLLASGAEAIAFPLLYLILMLLDDVFVMHWYTYLNGFFDTRTAKRLVPPISAAALIGVVLAGFSMPVLAQHIAPIWIISAWLFTLLIVIGLAQHIRRYLPLPPPPTTAAILNREQAQADEANPPETYLATMREGYQYVAGSPLLRWIALASLLAMIVLVLMEYVTSAFLLERLRTTEAIASFIGPVIALGSLLTFPIQFFLLGRLISTIGVGNAALIFPVGNLLISGSLVAAPSLPTAGLAYASRNNFYPFSFTITNLLYNAVPTRVQGRARAFTSGLILPAGAIIGGVLLLIVQTLDLFWLAAGLLLLVGVVYLATHWLIRKSYTDALLATLEEDDLSLQLMRLASEPGMVDPTLLNVLRKKLDESDSERSAIFLANLIHQIGGNEAQRILIDVALQTPQPTLRAAIVGMFLEAEQHNDALRDLYTTCLNDPSTEVRLIALQALQRMHGSDDLLQQIAEPLLDDPDPQVQAEAIALLLNTPSSAATSRAIDALQSLLADDRPALRERAVHVLGQSRNAQYVPLLLPALDDPADNVRLRAAVACEQVLASTMASEQALTDLLGQLSQRVNDPLERVRLAALLVLAYAGDANALRVFVNALSDSSPLVRSTAADILVQFGSGQPITPQAFSVPLEHGDLSYLHASSGNVTEHSSLRELAPAVLVLVQQMQQSTDRQRSAMATVILTRINRERYRAALLTLVESSLREVYQLRLYQQTMQPLTSDAALAAVQATLYEQSQSQLDDIFYMLSALSDARSIRLVQESLLSHLPHVRANAIEALESISSPQLASLIELICDREPATGAFAAATRHVGLTLPDLPTTLHYLVCQSPDAWQRAATVYALQHQLALAEPAPAPADSRPNPTNADLPPDPDPPSPARRRQKRLDNLLERVSAPSAPAPPPAAPVPHPAASPPPRATPTPLLDPAQVRAWLTLAQADPDPQVQAVLRTPHRTHTSPSLVERVLLLREVPFFEGMTIEQLRVLAHVCVAREYAAGATIFQPGDPAQSLYIVVRGQVVIDQEKRRGRYTKLAQADAGVAFGEASLFDPNPHSTRATATAPTLLLILSREPLIALASQNSTVMLAMVTVMSQRLRDAQARIADLTRAQPRQLQRLYDMLR